MANQITTLKVNDLQAKDLDQTDTKWDMGVADLIEETPVGSDTRKTRFRTVKRTGNDDNVVLMRPNPSWKQD